MKALAKQATIYMHKGWFEIPNPFWVMKKTNCYSDLPWTEQFQNVTDVNILKSY